MINSVFLCGKGEDKSTLSFSKKSITFNAQYVLTMISMTLANDNGDYGDNGNCVEII